MLGRGARAAVARWCAVLTLSMAATVPMPVGAEERAATYVVTLAVPDATRPVDPGSVRGGRRATLRRQRTVRLTRDLEERFDFRARQRYQWALSGFAARMTSGEAARLARDPAVASVRPARRIRLAAQVLPVGIVRTTAAPDGPPGPDVDVDVAIVDTGIGPIGGDELNVAGGVNCSGDGKGLDAWDDRWFTRHGTHVAGIVAARDNTIGAVGVAPGARLWSLRVFRADGYADESTVICALDWAVATHGASPPPGSQPIEAINMSLTGPRPLGAPEGCGVVGDPDLLHVAVCSAQAAGITLVAAAGNAARGTRHTVPAAYDQVITVAALSDFDGQPGGKATPTCASSVFGAEIDDTFARYSNFGLDVDVVAPGTCVVSTYPSTGGDATQRMSGTSMAAPHVAGAAARYLAAHPGTAPERVRALIRATGRLDWRTSTDPDWDGPSDSGGPDRLLDVRALMADQGDLRVWLLPGRIKVARAQLGRRVRVEVQRIGGHAGQVALGVSGLDGSVATATFPGGVLSGLAGLARRMRLAFLPGGTEGAFVARIEATGDGGAPAGSRRLRVLVDRTGPRIEGFRLGILRGRSLSARGALDVRLAWRATDALSAVRSSTLERRIGGDGWTAVGPPSRLETKLATLAKDGAFRFRVRSADTLGNRSTSEPLEGTYALRDSSSARLLSSGPWRTRRSDGALGGDVLVTSAPGARIATSIRGREIALVAAVGPDRGSLRVRIDAGSWRRIDLSNDRAAARRVVFRRHLGSGLHSVEIARASGAVDLDAIVIIR